MRVHSFPIVLSEGTIARDKKFAVPTRHTAFDSFMDIRGLIAHKVVGGISRWRSDRIRRGQWDLDRFFFQRAFFTRLGGFGCEVHRRVDFFSLLRNSFRVNTNSAHVCFRTSDNAR